MNNPKVSVVLPIYNVEKYLEECMSSLMKQTLRDIEIIMVDDGSPDNCPGMCDEYQKKDPRVRVLHKKNEGLGMARNSGLALATGEFVCFLDSDDFFDSEMLSEMYTKATANNLDAIYCCFRKVDIDGNFLFDELEVDSYTEFIGKENNIKHGLSMVGALEKGGKIYSMSACKVLFNRLFLVNNHLRFESERKFISEDMIFDIDFYLHSTRVGIIPKAYYNYRSNPSSLSKKRIPNHYMRCKVQYNEILRRLIAGGITDTSYHNVAHRYMVSRVTAIAYTAIANEYSREEVESIFYEISSDIDFWSVFIKNFPINNIEFVHRSLFLAVLKNRIWIWRLFVAVSKIKNRKLFSK